MTSQGTSFRRKAESIFTYKTIILVHAMMNVLVQRITLPLVLALVSVLLASCGGETKLDVMKPLRPQYDTFRKQLADMAAMEPKAAVRPPAALDPKPVLKGNNPESNTAVFMFEQLRDPSAGLSKPIPMDVRTSGRVLAQIRTAGIPDERLTDRAPKNLRQDLTDALKVRYIGAVKILEVKPARVIGTEGFERGYVKGVVMLFDRQTMKVVFADAFIAESDPKIRYTERKDQKADNAALQTWVNYNLSDNVKKAALKKFADGTGGVFESDKS